ncbi:hypothetical protein LWF15_32895 [Kineosporia rhizophila]|uniref:hypothetical protein n=1 Tax=Kineosporia rhizophila TaxID=84633 RepID=UPI001E4CF504|nr:hypothetical protein [Kineosporia rhizophila]MCE0540303.1 hypothetical protein [Kineosporia rhizophila]
MAALYMAAQGRAQPRHLVEQLVRDFNPQIMDMVVLTWIDLCADESKPDEFAMADDTPEPMKWAARVVFARLVGDELNWNALWGLSCDPDEWIERWTALLRFCTHRQE